jgi:hypothetical protein
MNCRQARRAIDAQLNHPRAPLPADDQAALRGHLAECAGCARFARTLDGGLPALKRLPTVPPNPRVLAALDQLPNRWWEQPAILRLRWWSGRATAFAAAALLIVFVSGILNSLIQPRSQAPATAATSVPAMAGAPPTADECTVDAPEANLIPAAVEEQALQQAIFEAVATTLGLTPQQLKTELAAGRPIDELAAQRSLDVAQIQAAGVAAGRAYLDGAVQRGAMAQADADKWSQVLPDLVAKTLALPAAGAEPAKPIPPKTPSSPQPETALDRLHNAVIAAAAGQLGLTSDQLVTELTNGVAISTLAQTRGVAPETIREAMLAAGRAHITDGTTNGTLSAEEAANLSEILPLLIDKLTATRDPQPTTKTGVPCAKDMPGTPAIAVNIAVPFEVLHAGAAGALGLSPEALQAELSAGKSLATLTQERNGDPAQVKAAMLAAGTNYIALAVQRGDITQADADELTADLPHLVEKLFQVGKQDPAGKGKPAQ